LKAKKITVFLSVALLIALGVIGCSLLQPQESPAPTPEQQPEQQIQGGQYEDGTYTGETETDERGWRGVVEIVVEDGEITEVDYDEFDDGDNPKSGDEEYNERWEEQAGISAEEAYPEYEEALIETQNIEEVDAISGATATHEKFTEAVRNALEQQ
jgi:major membrane immunogen (membrane-anchored lipoprotein)